MRNIFVIILVLVVSFVFTTNNVEAARYHKNRNHKVCTCPKGTMERGCMVHGNDCLAFGPHEHENTKGRRTNLPIFCTMGGYPFLDFERTCKIAIQKRQALQNYYRDQMRAATERKREQDRMSQRAQRGLRKIPIISDVLNVYQQEARRAYNGWRNDIRRDARDRARRFFGRR